VVGCLFGLSQGKKDCPNAPVVYIDDKGMMVGIGCPPEDADVAATHIFIDDDGETHFWWYERQENKWRECP